MEFTAVILRAVLGTVLTWLPVSPEVLPDLSGYLCPIYVGTAFAAVFYFRREIGVMPRGLIVRGAEEWPKIFLYSLLFTFAIGYPLGRRIGILGSSMLLLLDVALGMGLLMIGIIQRAALKLPEDIRAFVLSTMIGIFQGLSAPGISRASSSLMASLLVDEDVERAVKASLIASPGYFALRAVLLGEYSLNTAEVVLTSTVSFLLSLLMIYILLRSARYGRKFVIVYALTSLVLLWR